MPILLHHIFRPSQRLRNHPGNADNVNPARRAPKGQFHARGSSIFNGWIEIQSEAGKGSTFTLFPAIEAVMPSSKVKQVPSSLTPVKHRLITI
jgi:hypothetical protein